MSIAGIVCEYNPFHSGHKYHIDKTRQILGENTGIICAMSGNFVQRGDCAVFSKHSRAKAAVLNGADLVLELPTPWVLSSAEGFAYGAIAILNSLGIVTHLSFGSEAGDIDMLNAAATGLGASEHYIKNLMSTGIPYAAARQKALAEISPELGELVGSPNNILAVEYLKALDKLASPIKPITFSRHMAEHDGDTPSAEFASASFIRNSILNGNCAWEYMPDRATQIYKNEISDNGGPVSIDNCERAILAKLRSISPEDYDQLPGGSEGLAQRFMYYGQREISVQDVLEKTKSKRYPMSRIRRMLLCAWLGIAKEDSMGCPPYIRILAASKNGCSMLKKIKSKTDLPIITKPASAHRLDGRAGVIFELEARATSLYNLAAPNPIPGQTEWNTSPFILNNV